MCITEFYKVTAKRTVCSLLMTSMMWTFHLHDNQQHDADY